MSKSKNDIPVAGGRLRQTAHHARGQYDAIYTIIDPQTNKPYTYGRLAEDLAQRKEDYPQLAALIDPVFTQISKKAQIRPDSVFCVQRRGATKKAAAEKLQKECFPQIRAVMMLLFRPLYERNLVYGDVTVADFILYESETLYLGELPDTRTRLLGCLKNTILPEIGYKKLKDLDAEEQKKALRRIDRTLSKESAKSSRRAYVRRAYKGLIQAIETSGWRGSAAGMRLADLLNRSRERNTEILSSARPHCLDDVQRADLFRILEQPEHLYEYFLVSLLYAGMDVCEIAAACFGDFDVLEFSGQCCYTLTITRLVRKLHARYSTLSASNPDFPIKKLRRVVLPPWAGDILVHRLEQLRSLGLSDEKIREMRLSSIAADGTFERPDEINQRLESLLQEANIGSSAVTRTRRNGTPYKEAIQADAALLQRDAQHLAQLCGADLVMLHAMFGGSWSETDEQAYLDLLGDEYAVARYLRLRRWSPFSPAPLDNGSDGCLTGFSDCPARHILQVSNNSSRPAALTLSSNYAVHVYWKTQKGRDSS